MIIGWDTSTRRIGWCAGDPEALPTADAFVLPGFSEDVGGMVRAFDRAVRIIHRRFPATLWVFEAPILIPRDLKQPLVVRKLFAIAGHLEFLAHELGVEIEEEKVAALKRELAGFARAEKVDMVFAAEKAGIKLPATKEEGREDAADGFAAWLCGVRAHARRDIRDAWDRRLHSPRGMLL